MYFPNRDELSLRVVLALPKASRTGLVARICLSTSLASSKETLVFPFPSADGGFTEAIYRMMNLADSVFPAPLFGGEFAVIRWMRGAVPLSGDDNGLTSTIFCHCCVRILGNGKKMRFQLPSFPAAVCLDDLRPVQCDTLERIDGYQHNSTVRIDAMLGIAIPNRMQY